MKGAFYDQERTYRLFQYAWSTTLHGLKRPLSPKINSVLPR